MIPDWTFGEWVLNAFGFVGTVLGIMLAVVFVGDAIAGLFRPGRGWGK